MEQKPALVIAGPTASGKSGLALALAHDIGGTVINADALQIYNALPLLTAQPTPDECRDVPHRLYGFLDPRETSNAHFWRSRAVEEMQAAQTQGRVPIIVGGTGLYIKALVSGLSPLPGTTPAVRDALKADIDRLGNAALHARLANVDPQSAAKIPAGNTQRLIRALEVYISTNKTLSQWHEEKPVPLQGWRFFVATVLPQREKLYDSCYRRFELMMERGATEEVRQFEQKYPDNVAAKKALGYAPLKEFLQTKTDVALQQAISDSQQQTRNYAKRQVTWFRHQITSDLVLETPDPAKLKTACRSFLYGA